MTALKRRLPPPNSLVAFEAAARLKSFTAASEELGVTQAAVSRQIQHLESSLGTKLFARNYRKVSLTPAGIHFHRSVSMGLEFIASSAAELRRSTPDLTEITLTSTVAVSAFWLRPRIAGYLAVNPGLNIRLIATDDEQSDPWTSADLIIRYGRGKWPGMDAQFLFEEEIFPICSPRYKPSGEINRPSDLLREKLLHFDRKNLDWVDWETWLNHFGCQAQAEEYGLRFNNYTILIQAAIEGQGIGLGWSRLVAHFLKEKQLVRVLQDSLTTDRAYWLVWKSGSIAPSAEKFRDWLLKRANWETTS